MSYHTDDHNKQPWSICTCVRTTEEHQSPYHTHDHNKQPWSKGPSRASYLPHWPLQQATMKQGPHKNITLLITQMTGTNNDKASIKVEHHTSYHTDDCNRQPWSKGPSRASYFLPHWPLQQATMKQGPQKSITLLTTQMTGTSNHELSVTEEHHTSYHTDHCNKQPWSKDHTRTPHFLPHRWPQQETMK